MEHTTELTTKELDTATGGRATPPPPRLPIPYNPFAPPPPKTMERYIIGGAVQVVGTHGGSIRPLFIDGNYSSLIF